MLRRVLAILAGFGTLFIAAWNFVPAPTYALMHLSVGAPELSAWLLVTGALGVLLARPDRRRSRFGRATFAAALLGTVMAAAPFMQFPVAARAFDAAFTAALGDSAMRGVPAAQRDAMRPSHLSVRDLFLGVRIPEVRVTQDLPIAVVGGDSLKMAVYQPATPGRYPILVQIYGGAWQRGTPRSFGNFARWIASRGYVVFAIDYRHAPKSHWPAQLDDTRMMLTWIRDHASQYDGDTTRVAFIGRSAGAHLAMLAAWGDTPLHPRAIVDYYGPVDLEESYRHPPSPDPIDVRAMNESLIGGTLDQFTAAYRDASPIDHVSAKQAPILMVYASRDHLVQPSAGRRLERALTAAGTTAIYLEIPWADHAFDEVFQGPSNQLALFYTERFLAWALYGDGMK